MPTCVRTNWSGNASRSGRPKGRGLKAETELASVRTELQQERSKFNADRTQVVLMKDQLAAQLPVKDQQLATVSSEAAQRVEGLTRQLDQTRQLLEAAREQLAKQKETTYETADGQITWVNQGSRIVWIDLGERWLAAPDDVQRVRQRSGGRDDCTGQRPHRGHRGFLDDRGRSPHPAGLDLSNPILVDDIIYSPSFRRANGRTSPWPDYWTLTATDVAIKRS
jgi:hypothetical protein